MACKPEEENNEEDIDTPTADEIATNAESLINSEYNADGTPIDPNNDPASTSDSSSVVPADWDANSGDDNSNTPVDPAGNSDVAANPADNSDDLPLPSIDTSSGDDDFSGDNDLDTPVSVDTFSDF